MSKPFYVKFSVPKDMADSAYEALQMARDTGKLRKGTNETTKAIERAIARLVVIAEDVEPPEVVAHLPILCEERKVPYIFVPSKSQLGQSVGIDVGAASACITETGSADDLVRVIVQRLEDLRKSM